MKCSFSVLVFLFSALVLSGCGGGGAEFEPQGGIGNLASSDCLNCHGTTYSTALDNAIITNSGAFIVNTSTEIPGAPTLSEIRGDITDTHYDNWRLLANGTFISNSTPQIEGYVLNSTLTWAPEGQGYVSQSNPNQCYASCHDYHNIDTEVQNKWYLSGHANVLAEAFTSPSQGVCLRCHSSVGFANYVDSGNSLYPNWTPPSGAANTVPHHITCNACHDAGGYPSSDDPRLRISGKIKLFSGSGATNVSDAELTIGRNAVCITCHQARESGWSLYKTLVSKGVDPYDGTNGTITGQTFVNPHYRGAGAVIFSLKGFEYNGLTYTTGNVMHQGTLCTGCHMAKSDEPELGGHSMNIKYGSKENISVCRQCHGSVSSIESVGGLWDLDGDGSYNTPKEEIEGLKSLIIGNLASVGIIYNASVYPYFFKAGEPHAFANRVTTWKEAEIEAAFNLQFINQEPGAYAHNLKYAGQLLRDSYVVLNGTMGGKTYGEVIGLIQNSTTYGILNGSRPSGSDRPAFRYQ